MKPTTPAQSRPRTETFGRRMPKPIMPTGLSKMRPYRPRRRLKAKLTAKSASSDSHKFTDSENTMVARPNSAVIAEK